MMRDTPRQLPMIYTANFALLPVLLSTNDRRALQYCSTYSAVHAVQYMQCMQYMQYIKYMQYYCRTCSTVKHAVLQYMQYMQYMHGLFQQPSVT